MTVDELILDALKQALADAQPQRLYRSGKLPGLFPSRTGPAAEAALRSLTEGLLETVQTESKGKQLTEWVRITPRGVRFVQERDSAKAVLRELRSVLGQTRAGVPLWMDQARAELRELAERFEHQGREFLTRLDHLTARVEAALRRVEASGPGVSDALAEVVPWGVRVLEYMDDRQAAGAAGPCPLPELFAAVQEHEPGLTLAAFQSGLMRLDDAGAVKLVASGASVDPEFAMIHQNQLCVAVTR